ncbi:hypothetical protein COLO4_08481 [Corchorus olitorius]|uniref:Uncharacterized protein n=1 Tax=Corchorus olitorius TaxID=93759 RepID=A0A1R3KFL5_9ROSI|nr:hypothetical protein COLO4_08481 [Corchorus olitorius]
MKGAATPGEPPSSLPDRAPTAKRTRSEDITSMQASSTGKRILGMLKWKEKTGNTIAPISQTSLRSKSRERNTNNYASLGKNIHCEGVMKDSGLQLSAEQVEPDMELEGKFLSRRPLK